MVDLVISTGRTASSVAAEVGLYHTLVSRWIRRYGQPNKAGGALEPRPVASSLKPVPYVAEGYHQDFLLHHPDNGIAANDMPKVEAMQRLFPQNWREAPATVGPLAAR